jgi:proteasome lid subunit RPN8/RPN11
MNKLSEADVMAIRASQLTHHALAAEYGVSCALIGHIKTGRLWKHLDGPVYRNKPGRPSARKEY